MNIIVSDEENDFIEFYQQRFKDEVINGSTP